MSLDNLQQWADFFDSASGGSWLLALALVTLVMAVAGLWAAALWLAKLPARSRPGQSVGCQRFDPSEDRVEEFIRDALRYETDQQMLRRGGRLDAADIHDVFPEEEER